MVAGSTPPRPSKPLRTWRRNALMSQHDLALKAGVTPSTIYLIETGRTQPRLKIMRLVSQALGVSPMEVEEFRITLEAGDSQERANTRRREMKALQ